MVDLATALLKVAPEVRVFLLGDGMEKSLIRDKAAAAGVLDVNLFMEDRVPKKDMPGVLAASDIVCSLFVDMKEMQANSANKFFDTLAAGKPILLNYGGWQAEIVERAGCGLVTWKRDFEEAARMIAQRLDDKDWLDETGRAAKRIGNELFDRDVLAKQLSEVLLAAADRCGSRASGIASGDYSRV
ncbi:glycosyltransferase [Thauera aminoaromatica S2]|uniref:Glycosyltransferase n=2 Tax=Thauera aminoaromatica TaxID=164330 RepID=N6Y113_THASP|nr:glycosyltransferase [Thauera aminoaromatica S2]